MTDPRFEPRHADMGRHITSGILNSGAVQLIRLLCQFGSVIILSRLLAPADFGLLAMVGPVFGFVTLFQDLGLSQATIQKPALTHDEVNAFFWLNLAAGSALTTLVVLLSPAVGWYYHEPRLTALTAAMGLLILVNAAGSQAGALMTRRMEFGLLSLNGTIGAVLGLLVSIVLALLTRSYWALYWGIVVSTVVPVCGIWLAAKWRPTQPRRVAGLGAMLRFGGGVTSANATAFFSTNMDNVLIGWKWGEQQLGLYDRAYKLLLFPIQRIVGPVMTTMVPVLSRLQAEPEQYRSILVKTLSQLTLATWPGIVWAIVLSDTLVPVLLGPQWVASAAIFLPLAIAGLMQVPNYAMGCMLISQGHSGKYARLSFVRAIVDVSSYAIGLPFGVIGVAVSFAVSEFLRTPVFWWYTTKQGPVGMWDVPRAIWPQTIGSIVAWGALLLYRAALQSVPLPPILLLAGGLVLSYLACAATMACSAKGRVALGQILRAAQGMARHVQSKFGA